MTDWRIYRGTGDISKLPDPPPWRKFPDPTQPDPKTLGSKFLIEQHEIDAVNAALLLRRPLLLTGKPGVGKSSLAYSVASELGLGNVLVWSITSRSILRDALYLYDAIGRLQESNLPGSESRSIPDIGKYITLGPLGTALANSKHKKPRVLLIDEIDKSDFDLPNDLLNLFEEGWFEIPELARHSQDKIKVQGHNREDVPEIVNGRVICKEFPFVVLTSNEERQLPPPFMRRCLRLEIAIPTPKRLAEIIQTHLGNIKLSKNRSLLDLCQQFIQRREHGFIATDQLLNAIYLLTNKAISEASLITDADQPATQDEKALLDVILKSLDELR